MNMQGKMEHEVELMCSRAPFNTPLPDDAMEDREDSLQLGAWHLSKREPLLRYGGAATLGPEAHFKTLQVGSGVAVVVIINSTEYRFCGWVEETRSRLAQSWVDRLNDQLEQSRQALVGISQR